MEKAKEKKKTQEMQVHFAGLRERRESHSVCCVYKSPPCLLLVFLGHLSYKSLLVATSIPRVTAPALIRECCTRKMLAERRQILQPRTSSEHRRAREDNLKKLQLCK